MTGAGVQADETAAAAVGAAVSVVVIGRNEGERLGRCLAAIRALDAASTPREILYVDSGSTDDSLALAAQHGARVIALHPEHPTAALGRNAGWRNASGKFVLFLDGDTELAPDFLRRALECFAQPEVKVVWGHRRELCPHGSVYNRVLDLDWIYPPGPAAFCGGDALFRRSTLLATGGFVESLIAGEEPELCRRILAQGGTILHLDTAMTGHDLQITRFAQYWRRAERAGHAYAEVSARFAGTADRFWSADAQRNRVRAALLLLLPAAALLATCWLRSSVPVGSLLLLLAALVARTAWKARWKSRDAGTLLLYGVHSHLQQIPIFAGQMRFLLQRRRGVRQGLVEYREP